jgi:hypothetical protein
MILSERTWLRHANPWSVWTRYAAFPFLVLAVWSYHGIGWWSLVPIFAVAAFLWFNPIVSTINVLVGKSWFNDRMVWLFCERSPETPEYASWPR